MELLLLLYAMLAGLAGINTGADAIARVPEMALGSVVSGISRVSIVQSDIAVRAMAMRAAMILHHPSQARGDARTRTITMDAPVLILISAQRAAPERRRE